jgi:enhancing lycopene biosynthesis protein 2
MSKIAVILSGSGYLDGAEIREAVLSLLYLDELGAEATCFAPDRMQHHVVNHLTGDEADESRNILVEAARIARGHIQPLNQFKAEEFDGLLIPGGFGVAKNFSDLAFKGAEASVDPEFASIVKTFAAAAKPIGAICIAPAVIAAVLGDHNAPLVTIGEDEGTAAAIESFGAKHENCASSDSIADNAHKIVSCSAYMREDSISEIAKGIKKVVTQLVEWA